MRLAHLGLLVRDQERSLRFYTAYFGFDPTTATRYPDGTVIIRDAEDFDLALHAGDGGVALPRFLHFGFRCRERDDVVALHGRLVADGVRIVELDDEPGLFSFKCVDPDGYPVEVYWEPLDGRQPH
jgi:catechol 2,3-dioxygenase-like lactoylglutathione lyase family enzyme